MMKFWVIFLGSFVSGSSKMSSNIRINRIFGYCHQKFVAKTLTTKYCSHTCNQRDYKKKSMILLKLLKKIALRVAKFLAFSFTVYNNVDNVHLVIKQIV